MSTHSSLGRDCIWGIEKTNVFGLRYFSSSHDFRVTFFKKLGFVFLVPKENVIFEQNMGVCEFLT